MLTFIENRFSRSAKNTCISHNAFPSFDMTVAVRNYKKLFNIKLSRNQLFILKLPQFLYFETADKNCLNKTSEE